MPELSAMDQEGIDRVIDDRFRRWGGAMREGGATPILCVGLNSSTGDLMISSPEELPDQFVCNLLIVAAARLATGAPSDPGNRSGDRSDGRAG